MLHSLSIPHVWTTCMDCLIGFAIAGISTLWFTCFPGYTVSYILESSDGGWYCNCWLGLGLYHIPSWKGE